MKRELSSFDIYTLVSEFQELIDSYIDKIYQLSKNELLIRVNNVNKGQRENIYIRSGDLICVSQRKFTTPMKPTTFAMTLRKYIQNGKIKEITQHEFDRIIKIVISKGEGDFTLVVELFSDGNVILVDPKGNIVVAWFSRTWTHRTVKAKKPYVPPPSQLNPFTLSLSDFDNLIRESTRDLVRTLAADGNLGGLYAEEVCLRADADKNIETNKLSHENIKHIYQVFSDFLNLFKQSRFNPTIVKDKGNIVDVLPFEFNWYKDKKVEYEHKPSFNEAVQALLVAEKKEEKDERDEVFEEKIGKLKRQKKQQQQRITSLKKDVEKKHNQGEIIYLNYQQCEQLIEESKRILEEAESNEEKKEKIEQLPQVTGFIPDDQVIMVKLPDKKGNLVELKIHLRLSVAENAEQAYKKSKQFKDKIQGAKAALGKTEKKLKQTIEQMNHEKKQRKKQEVEKRKERQQKRFWFEQYRWFISSNGNVVVAGKDAKSNEQVVKKYLQKGDRYAHADVQGAPSCVIKNEDAQGQKQGITEETLVEACYFAASFSKAWKRFHEAQAYWVLPQQVSKTPESGEYLPKGAFMIRGKRNYCKCKLEVAVGDISIDSTKKIMGGPVSAVKKQTERYAIVQPGNEKKNQVAKQLAEALNASVDEVTQVLPPGDMQVVETKGLSLSE